ncbi:MAG TPA: hypothetical protein VD833_23035 [Vicinamibacterales bacterium]|nr:hypothetical protein [Vicinamibacterales bacterium]
MLSLAGAVIALVVCLSGQAFGQATHLVVVVGLGGDAEYQQTFQRWATTLVEGAGKLGVPPGNVIYLSEKPDADPKRITGPSSRESIVQAFARLASRTADDDVVFVVLIGFGSFDGKVAKFNLPGPDMAAGDFDPLLKKLRARHIVVVNTASASGPFIEALAGPGRTIVTATRSGSERFATLFGGYFVDALVGFDADEDRNRRVTVLEAFTWARREVNNAYEREGIMRTENALLNDSGNEGVPDPSATGKQGRVAAMLALGSASAAEPLSEDPRVRALAQERQELERRVEALRLLKDSMPAEKYTSELEKLVTEIALKTREIRALEKK